VQSCEAFEEARVLLKRSAGSVGPGARASRQSETVCAGCYSPKGSLGLLVHDCGGIPLARQIDKLQHYVHHGLSLSGDFPEWQCEGFVFSTCRMVQYAEIVSFCMIDTILPSKHNHRTSTVGEPLSAVRMADSEAPQSLCSRKH
jgi:hypothetical protein